MVSAEEFAKVQKQVKKLVRGCCCSGGSTSDGCCYYEVTLAEANTLISNSELVKGATYKVTGVHKNKVGITIPVLYDDGNDEGVTVYLTAVTNSKLSVEGYGEFYNPKYDKTDYGVEASLFRGVKVMEGSGYSDGTGVATTGGSGTGMTVDIVTASGFVQSVTIANQGSGYVSGETLTITTGNADATFIIGKAPKMYNIWDGDNPDAHFVPIYTIGQKVIWGGYVWENVNGLPGAAVSYTELDAEWIKVAYNLTDYNKVIDYIEYDITNDWIVRRRSGEKVVDVIFPYQYWNSNENIYNVTLHGISVVQWGNHYDYTTETGTGLIIAEDSYIETANFKGKKMLGVKGVNYSVVRNNYRGYNTEFKDILLDNSSYQTNCNFTTGSKQESFILSNKSYQDFINLRNNSVQRVVSILNESWQSGNGDREGFLDNGIHDTSTYTNGSYSSDPQLTNSTASRLFMTNNSYEDATTLITSTLSSILAENISSFTFELTNTNRSQYIMRNVTSFGFTNTTGLDNSLVVADGDIIEYSIRKDFTGGVGAGAVGSITIPMLHIPNENSFIEEIIVYSDGLTGGAGSYISLGIETDDVDSGLDIVSGLVATLAATPIIKYSNLPFTKSTANNRIIVMAVNAAAITAGVIQIKIRIRRFI